MSDPALNKKLRQAARKGRVEEIVRLLDAGADIESRGGFFSLGQTPLACAIFSGQTAAAKYLLERGANPEARDAGGDTPLWMAAAYDRKEIVALLLKHGADPRQRCEMEDRETPLENAMRNKHNDIAKMLSEAIVRRHAQDRAVRLAAERKREEQEKQARDAERNKDRDIVIVSTQLGDRTLQEVYNFAALERISLIRAAEDGPVEVMTRQDFADIGDKPALRQAFAEHLRRGGTAEENAVFPGSLQKIKPLSPGRGL